MLVQIYASEKDVKNLGVGVVENGCDQSCDGTLKLIISEERTNEIN